MTSFALSQILIGFAICTDLLSFQLKQRNHIVCCLLISCLLISLHFICLGHWTAACLGLLAASRFLTSLLTTSRIALAIYLVLTLAAGAVTYAGLLTLISCTGALFGTLASFCRKDKTLRQLMLVCTSFWIVHNILAGSPAAVLMEILFISSNLVGYFRYYIRTAQRAPV